MRGYCSISVCTWNLKVGCTLSCSERFCLKAKLAAMPCLQLLRNVINQVPDTTESRQEKKSLEQASFRRIMRLPFAFD